MNNLDPRILRFMRIASKVLAKMFYIIMFMDKCNNQEEMESRIKLHRDILYLIQDL